MQAKFKTQINFRNVLQNKAVMFDLSRKDNLDYVNLLFSEIRLIIA